MSMHSAIKKLNLIKNEIKEIVDRKQLKFIPEIIAVTKTFGIEAIQSALDLGIKCIGENKVQEIEKKIPLIKN